MAGYDLEFLVKAFQAAVDGAQRSVREKQEARVRHVIDMGEDGELRSVAWQCCRTNQGGEEHSYEMLRVAFLPLETSELLGIAEVSVSLDCTLSHPPRLEHQALRPRMIATTRCGIQRRLAQGNRLEMEFSCADEVRAHVRVDGTPLDDFTATGLGLSDRNDTMQPNAHLDEDASGRHGPPTDHRFRTMPVPPSVILWVALALLIAAIARLVL